MKTICNERMCHRDVSDLKQPNEYFCGPACAANSIINFMNNENIQFSYDSPAELVNELAYYLQTTEKGTTADNLCKGINEYLDKKGFCPKIKYKGFRPVNEAYKENSEIPLEWIKNELSDRKSIILNIGIYIKNVTETDVKYVREEGHYINAVGYTADGLIITDPYNKSAGLINITLHKIDKGTLIHNVSDNEIALTNNAAGFYEILPPFDYFDPGEIAILNGAISIDIEI